MHIFCLAATFAAGQTAVKAQTAAFLNINPDPVSMSLGGNSASVGATPFSIWNNVAAPALGDENFQAGASYSLWQPSYSSDDIAAVAGYGRVARFMTVSAGVRYASHARYDVTDGLTGAVTGSFAPSDIQAGVGFGFRVCPVFSLGAGVNYVYSHIGGPQKGNAVAADFGAFLDLDYLRVGVTASNIGSRLDYGGESSYYLPSNVKIGAGTTRHFGQKDLHALSVDIEGGMTLHSPSFFAGAGLQYSYKGLVRAAAGYHYGNPDKAMTGQYVSVGAGVKLYGISLDVAYLAGVSHDSPLKNTFSVGVGYSF